MKKNLMLAAVFAVVIFAISASAQKATDFSGTWTLDVGKSKLGDRNTIESQTITVTQTAVDIKVETVTKRLPPDGTRGSGGRGGSFAGGDGTVTYTLDGKDVRSTISSQMGDMQVTSRAKLDGSKIEITRSIATPMGDRTSTEKWSLGSDGLLTIESTRPGRDGSAETTIRTFQKAVATTDR